MRDVVEREIDEARGAKHVRVEPDALRLQRGPQSVERAIGLGRDVPDVRAQLGVDRHDHRFRVAHGRRADGGRGPVDDPRHVADLQHCPARRAHRTGGQLRGGGELPPGIDRNPLVGVVEHPGPANGRRAPRGAHQIRQPESDGSQSREVGLDLELPNLAAKDGHAADARYGEESWAQCPVGKRPDVADAVGGRRQAHDEGGTGR